MKTLIVYYSFDGNTKAAAELLAKKTDGDLLELVPVKDYPRGQASKFFYGGMTAIFGQKPKLKPYRIRVEDYDLILIGTPVWAGRNAPPINTFLRGHSLKGKTVALFASSGGGNAEGCFKHMKSKLGNDAATLSLVNAAEDLKRTEEQINAFADTLSRQV